MHVGPVPHKRIKKRATLATTGMMSFIVAEPQDGVIPAGDIQGAYRDPGKRLRGWSSSSAAFAAMAVECVLEGILNRKGNRVAIALTAKGALSSVMTPPDLLSYLLPQS